MVIALTPVKKLIRIKCWCGGDYIQVAGIKYNVKTLI